jgi:exosortase E/protease (VPEID-CTERM system)
MTSGDHHKLSVTMTIEPAEPVRKPRWPYLYWGALLGLLVAEVLGFTLRFDASYTRIDRRGWLAALIRRSPELLGLGICIGIVVALVLVGSVRRDRELRRLTERHTQSRQTLYWLTAHLASSIALAWLTGSILEGSALSSDPVSWVAVWIGAGLATLSCWMLAAFPLIGWCRLVETRWRGLLYGVLVSVVARLLGCWTSSFWGMFHRSTFWAVRGVLGLFRGDVICIPDEFKLGTERFGVEISSQCSGYEGIGLVWVFLGVFYWWFRHELRFPHALLLMPLGTMLSWMANVLRIAALILVGDRGWPDVAMGGFHSQVGWLAFNAIGLGLVVLARRVRLFSKVERSPEPEPAVGVNPAAVFLGPMVAIALTMMLTAVIAQGGFDRFYAARVLAAIAVFWYFRRQYVTLRGSWSWDAIAAGVAVYVIWMALEPMPESSETMITIPAALARMPRFWAGAWLVARAVGSVIVIPLAEELAFRGYLTRRLIAADFQSVPEGRFTWPSFLLSSLLFGLLHQRWFAGTIAGMAYALVYYRRGKLIDAVIAHAITNLSITVYVFATGEWYKWS